jgi:serine/threonine-protein kinase RsbW
VGEGRLIRLHVPGSLEYRDLAIRVVAAACKLVGGDERRRGAVTPWADFDSQVISAFSEAFNNAALHNYRNRPLGELEIEVETERDRITIRLADYGESFDLAQVAAPDLDALPESGLGIYIIQSFMDEVVYRSGARNVLSMSKQIGSGGRSGDGGDADGNGGAS